MRAPPFLSGAGLLVWGWQANTWLAAILLAVLLEGARLLPWRWQMNDRELNRSVDVCGLAFAALAIYAAVGGPFVSAILTVLKWTPVVLSPLVLIQQYTNRDRLPLSALSMQQRKRGDSRLTIDVGYPYFIICLISASAGNRAPFGFYLAVMSLWAWALWGQRNRRFSPILWAILFVLAGGLGHLANTGLGNLQGFLENRLPNWLMAWLDPETDPYQQSTAMGAIGRLKDSSRIVLRIPASARQTVPDLLRTASYNTLWGNTWLARTVTFTPLKKPAELTWQIYPHTGPGLSLTVLYNLRAGRGALPLPLGAYRVSGIPAASLERNPLGTVAALDAPEVVRYGIAYDSAGESGSPTAEDLQIPIAYQKGLAELATQLGLMQRPPRQVLDILRDYLKGFSYSLDLRVADRNLPPLLDFLHNTRSGHCEYFASATVLLLRQAGIPARYTAGYSVQEYSTLEKRYIVRRRHAHAWAVAYLDGRWQNVDTTPAVGWTVDARSDPPWTGFYDVLSWLWSRFQEWRMQEDNPLDAVLGWLLLPLLLLLVWRLRRQQRLRRQGPEQPLSPAVQGPGADSDCYRIAAWYAAQGLEHPPGEPLAGWLTRLTRDPERHRLLAEILPLHYRYRFDPAGISAAERRRLYHLVQEWLKR